MMAPSVSFKEIRAKFVSLTDPTVYRDVFRTQSNTYDGFFWISEVFLEIWQNSQENNRLRLWHSCFLHILQNFFTLSAMPNLNSADFTTPN